MKVLIYLKAFLMQAKFPVTGDSEDLLRCNPGQVFVMRCS